MKKILILNGPNINMLGIREPELYGKQDFKSLITYCERVCAENGFEMESYQSNHEGDLVDKIQDCYGKIDGIVFNPAAYTHTSVAILDAVKAVSIPTIEVHLTDVNSRDEFRKISYIREACAATFAGDGFGSYRKAIEKLKEMLG